MKNIKTTYRIALGVEYDGTNYHGWQSQNNLRTIQSAVEAALTKVAKQPIKIFCAGRTDVGVHAIEQVIHFDTEQKRPLKAWLLGTNNYLPHDIRIQWSKEVPPTFHARFSAISRHYRYIIYNNPIPSAILLNKVFWFPRPLNIAKMRKASKYLIGEHDFSSFRSSDCQSKSTKRYVESIKFHQQNSLIIIDIKANAFLHRMVRNIIGALLPIGLGEKEPKWLKELLMLRDRTKGGITAKAAGLYLISAKYPNEYDLPQSPLKHATKNWQRLLFY